LHKQPSLKARLKLFATNITVLEMRWQHVPNLGCRDAETARTIYARSEYVIQSCYRYQQSEAENERERTETIGEQMSFPGYVRENFGMCVCALLRPTNLTHRTRNMNVICGLLIARFISPTTNALCRCESRDPYIFVMQCFVFLDANHR